MNTSSLEILSGNPILVKELNLMIHQPTLKQLGMVGEQQLFEMLGVMSITTDAIVDILYKNNEEFDEVQEKEVRETTTDLFWFLNQIMSEASNFVTMTIVYQLLFPDFTLVIDPSNTFYTLEHKKNSVVKIKIDDYGHKVLRPYIEMLIGKKQDNGREDEMSNHAKLIAAKIAEGKRKRDALKGDTQTLRNPFSNLVSSVAVGLNVSLREVLEYTFPQLYNQFDRMNALNLYNDSRAALMAGAEDVELKSWLGDLEDNT